VLDSPSVWKHMLLASADQQGGSLHGFSGNFYHQRGAGLPGYGGNPYQRGGGLGSFFRGLFRMAMPVIKKAAKAVGKQALKTGVSVLADVARGQEVLPSLETHGREAVATLADKTLTYLNKRPAEQEGAGGGGGGGGGCRKKRFKRSSTSARKTVRKRKGKRKTGVRKRKPKRKKSSARKSIKGRKGRKRKPAARRSRSKLHQPRDIFDHVVG